MMYRTCTRDLCPCLAPELSLTDLCPKPRPRDPIEGSRALFNATTAKAGRLTFNPQVLESLNTVLYRYTATYDGLVAIVFRSQ